MQTIGAYEAKTHLPRLFERVARGETLTITRHGQPVARLVPVETDDRERAAQAARRIEERRKRLGKDTQAGLIDSIHEGHRF